MSVMRVNIRLKTVILLVFFALILSGTALSVSTSIINRIVEEHCIEHANELANANALTGVRNKRSYYLEIQKLEEKRKKEESDFAIAIIDLNYLKQINDRYGHEMGDLAIRTAIKRWKIPSVMRMRKCTG